MRVFGVAVAVALAWGGLVLAQEREVPNDSSRISIPGCAKDRTFVVERPREDEPVRSDIAAGRRFRLNGPKEILGDIKARQGSMVEVTGLVRKSQLSGPGGIAIAGGRVRIGGGSPQSPMANPSQDPMYNVVVIDVESWRQLPGSCPAR